MVRHYSIKSLFRQMPNALLARYFGERGFFTELDFAGMKEGAPSALFVAWRDLPDSQRNPLEVDLRQIFDMSCENGWLAILDEARWQFCDDAEELAAFCDAMSDLSNHYARAMLTFLDYCACWHAYPVASQISDLANSHDWRCLGGRRAARKLPSTRGVARRCGHTLECGTRDAT